MDTSPLVTEQIDVGQMIVDACLNQRISLVAAAWLKPAEDEHWYLYLATNLVELHGLAAAYKAILAVIRKLPPSALFDSLDDLKVIGEGNPITLDMKAIQGRYPMPLATRYHGNQLGSVSIKEAYIYPAVRPVPSAL